MILTAHQPTYLPWLGLLAKIAQADQFVIFDAVQYETRGWTNRNQIKTNAGPLMLSVPVESSNHLEKRICDIKIVPGNWARKHWRSIELAYAKAPFFGKYAGELEFLLVGRPWTTLAGLNIAILQWLLKCFEIEVPMTRASEQDFRGSKSDLVLDMCRKMGATTYIFGSQGRGYADVEAFRAAGIEVRFQDFRHPVYPQLHGEFAPNMAAIDLLLNHGHNSRDILFNAVGGHAAA